MPWERGYTNAEIAAKIHFTPDYIAAICYLLEHGEERLLVAVERGVMPANIAMEIARAPDGDIQQALAEVYENKLLPGNQILAIRRSCRSRGGGRLPLGRWRGGFPISAIDGRNTACVLRASRSLLCERDPLAFVAVLEAAPNQLTETCSPRLWPRSILVRRASSRGGASPVVLSLRSLDFR